MLKSLFLKKLTSQLCETLPSQMKTLKKDFEKNCHHVLNRTFSKLDLVTRKDFDIQSKVLSRTRQKLEELQQHLAKLEKAAKDKHKK